MTSPVNNDIVFVAAGREFEISVSITDGAMTVGEFVESVTGAAPAQVLVDGFPVSNDRAMGGVALSRGSRLEVVDGVRSDPVCALVGLSGVVGGHVVYLAPGAHQLGSIDVGVQVRSTQGGAVCLYVDADGAAQIDPGGGEVVVDSVSVASITPIQPGAELEIEGRPYRFVLTSQPVGQGRVAFNRPPRSEFPASLPLLVAPGAPPAAQKPMRFGWGALVIPVLIGGIMAVLWSPMMAIFAVFSPAMMLANWYEDKRRARQANAEASTEVAKAMVDFGRRFAALRAAARTLAWRGTPMPATVLERAVAGDARMWQRRHDHPDFMELGIGTGTLEWRPEVTPAAADRAEEANVLLEQHPEMADTPVTVDLADGQVLGIAGHRRRQVEMVRWLLAQAAFHHGPADLSLAVVTDHPQEWDWSKWLPHIQHNGDGDRLAVATPGQRSRRTTGASSRGGRYRSGGRVARAPPGAGGSGDRRHR